MACHSSTLAWKIPWMEEPGWLQSMGSHSWTRLSDFTFTFHFHELEKEMATHSSVLAWRIPGMGSHRVGHDCSDLAAELSNSGISFVTIVTRGIKLLSQQMKNQNICFTFLQFLLILLQKLNKSLHLGEFQTLHQSLKFNACYRWCWLLSKGYFFPNMYHGCSSNTMI